MIETNSARIAIIRATMLGHESAGEHDQARYGVRIQRSRGSSTAGAIAHGVTAGEILATVDHQREPVRSWLYCAYAEPPWEWITAQMLEMVHASLRREFRAATGHKLPPHRESVLLKMTLNDKRAGLNGQGTLGGAEYRAALGIDRASWHRHYAEKAKTARDIVDDWDREGRGAVAKRLSECITA